MSTESAFNKRLRPETTFDRIEAILEHLNLPPIFVEFVRKNRRLVFTCVAFLLFAIVAGSFYMSYAEERRERAASALSFAEALEGTKRSTALEKVAADFSLTSAALWAKITIAQQQMAEEKYKEAAAQYGMLVDQEKQNNPLWPLLVFGKAEALEGAGLWDDAIASYTILQDIAGYESLGYLGVGRINEQQGKEDQALAVYNNFLLNAGDEAHLQQEKQAMEAEIARVKVIMENKK